MKEIKKSHVPKEFKGLKDVKDSKDIKDSKDLK